MPFVPDSSSFVPDKPDEKGFFGKVWGATQSSAAKRFASVADSFKANWNREVTPMETSLHTVGAMAGFANDVIGAALIEGVQAVSGGKAGDAGLAFLQTPVGQAGLTAVSMGTDAYRAWKADHQREAKSLESVVNIGFLLSMAKGASSVGSSAKKGVQSVGSAASKVGTKVSPYLDDAAATAKTGFSAVKETASQIGSKFKNAFTKGKEAIKGQAAVANLDDASRAAVHAGVPEKILTRISTTTPETASLMKKMVAWGKNHLDDIRFRNRPVEVAGEKLTESAHFLSKSMKETGKKLGEVKKSLGGKMVEIPKVRQELLNDLDDLGISVGKNGKLVTKNPVSDDVLEVLEDMQKYVGWSKKTVGKVDAANLDRLRSYLFKSFSKTGVPLQSQAQGLVTKYRKLLLESLDDIDPVYGKLAKEYGTKHQALEEFTKLMGYKGSMEDITTKSLRAGEVSMRVLGNAADRPKTVIDDLLNAAKEAGYKGKENIYDLIDFADELDDILGPTSRSLGGQVERAGESVLGKVPVVGKVLEAAALQGNATAKQQLQVIANLLNSLY